MRKQLKRQKAVKKQKAKRMQKRVYGEVEPDVGKSRHPQRHTRAQAARDNSKSGGGEEENQSIRGRQGNKNGGC